MIEEQTIRFLDTLRPFLASVPPTTYVAVLIGAVNSCVFYMIFGRSFRAFLPFVVIGSGAAVLGTTVGARLPETGPLLGDVSVVAATVCTWTILFIARALRL